MPLFLISFLLFGLPLIVLPIGYSNYEVTKVLIAQLGIELLLFWQLFHLKSLRFSSFKKPYLWPLGLIFLDSLIGLLTGPAQANFFGNIFRLQGVLLLWHLLVLALVTPKVSLAKLPKWLPLTCLSLLFLTTVLNGQNLAGRFYGSLGEPNALAASAVMIWPFIYYFSRRPVQVASLILSSLIIFLSGSRSGELAFLIELAFLGLLRLGKLPLKVVVIICSILIFLSYTGPFLDQGRIWENRSEIWKTAGYAGLSKPVLGYGFGNVQLALEQSAVKLQNTLRYEMVDSSHNLFLDFWVEGGSVGLISLIVVLVLAIRYLIKQDRQAELMALIGILTALSFNPASLVSLIGLWFIVSQGRAPRCK